MEFRSRYAFIAAIAVFLLGMAFLSVVSDERYMMVSVVLVLVSMLPLFIRFELRQMHAREIVLIAMLAAIASISRVPFAALPSVQPVSFVIIVSAITFGAESGFMIGAFAALVSNMFLGQGPWTPWQMFAWGMVGFSAGLLHRIGWLRHRGLLLAFGFAWGFLFGWIMNLWAATSLLSERNWAGLAALYSASFYFDLAHALSNVLFLGLFAPGWLKVLQRFRRKYGLLDARPASTRKDS